MRGVAREEEDEADQAEMEVEVEKTTKSNYNWADTGGRNVANQIARLEGASVSSRRFSQSSATSKWSNGRTEEPRQVGGGGGTKPKDGKKKLSANFVLPEGDDRRIRGRLVNKNFEAQGREGGGGEEKKKKKKISTDKLERFLNSRLGQALAEFLSDSEDDQQQKEDGGGNQ